MKDDNEDIISQESSMKDDEDLDEDIISQEDLDEDEDIISQEDLDEDEDIISQEDLDEDDNEDEDIISQEDLDDNEDEDIISQEDLDGNLVNIISILSGEPGLSDSSEFFEMLDFEENANLIFFAPTNAAWINFYEKIKKNKDVIINKKKNAIINLLKDHIVKKEDFVDEGNLKMMSGIEVSHINNKFGDTNIIVRVGDVFLIDNIYDKNKPVSSEKSGKTVKVADVTTQTDNQEGKFVGSSKITDDPDLPEIVKNVMSEDYDEDTSEKSDKSENVRDFIGNEDYIISSMILSEAGIYNGESIMDTFEDEETGTYFIIPDDIWIEITHAEDKDEAINIVSEMIDDDETSFLKYYAIDSYNLMHIENGDPVELINGETIFIDVDSIIETKYFDSQVVHIINTTDFFIGNEYDEEIIDQDEEIIDQDEEIIDQDDSEVDQDDSEVDLDDL